MVEYALRHVEAPIGVSSYRLMLADALPEDLASALPSPAELAPGLQPSSVEDDA